MILRGVKSTCNLQQQERTKAFEVCPPVSGSRSQCFQVLLRQLRLSPGPRSSELPIRGGSQWALRGVSHWAHPDHHCHHDLYLHHGVLSSILTLFALEVAQRALYAWSRYVVVFAMGGRDTNAASTRASRPPQSQRSMCSTCFRP